MKKSDKSLPLNTQNWHSWTKVRPSVVHVKCYVTHKTYCMPVNQNNNGEQSTNESHLGCAMYLLVNYQLISSTTWRFFNSFISSPPQFDIMLTECLNYEQTNNCVSFYCLPHPIDRVSHVIITLQEIPRCLTWIPNGVLYIHQQSLLFHTFFISPGGKNERKK